ncbi:MAG: ABC transporter permease subunit [Pyrinomonadaceae bacterium]
MLLGLACVLGMPVGIAAGVYLAEFGDNWFGRLVRFVADTLTGVPSIVVGVFAYTLIVIPMQQFSAFAGGLALALIMFPIVARTTEEMIRLRRLACAEGALALGAPQWRVITGVVLPAAASESRPERCSPSRALPEKPRRFSLPPSITSSYSYHLDQPIASLTVQIYNYAISPYDEWHAQAWAATLVLMVIILTINILVRTLTRKKF